MTRLLDIAFALPVVVAGASVPARLSLAAFVGLPGVVLAITGGMPAALLMRRRTPD